MHEKIAKQRVSAEPVGDDIPDLKPFEVDLFLLRPLMKLNRSTLQVAVIFSLLAAGAIIWTASDSNLFFRPAGSGSLWNDIWMFVRHGSSGAPDQTMPYLRDYPSIILTVTVVGSVTLVYGLFTGAATLHSEMMRSGVFSFEDDTEKALKKDVEEINKKLRRWGYASPLVFFIIVAAMFMTNLSLQSDLHAFLAPGLYERWWASLSPLRPGAVVWVLFGSVGIYAFYCEAVLGLTYVSFLRAVLKALRQSRSQVNPSEKVYGFKANMLNPDGFWGWERLRQLITNMQMGAVLTVLSAWGFSFFLQYAMGMVATVVVLATSIGIVTFVYVSVNRSFSQEVGYDKKRQIDIIAEQVATAEANIKAAERAGGKADPGDLLRILVAYRRMDFIEKVPSTPIRQRWLVAGLVTLLGAVSAIAAPVFEYLVSP